MLSSFSKLMCLEYMMAAQTKKLFIHDLTSIWYLIDSKHCQKSIIFLQSFILDFSYYYYAIFTAGAGCSQNVLPSSAFYSSSSYSSSRGSRYSPTGGSSTQTIRSVEFWLRPVQKPWSGFKPFIKLNKDLGKPQKSYVFSGPTTKALTYPLPLELSGYLFIPPSPS